MSAVPTYNGEYAGFLAGAIRRAKALTKLHAMRESAAKRGHYQCEDALWEGIFALNHALDDDIDKACKRGQLLLAWEGSKALEGMTP